MDKVTISLKEKYSNITRMKKIFKTMDCLGCGIEGRLSLSWVSFRHLVARKIVFKKQTSLD